MIYLFKAPPNGTPTLDTRSVRKNTSKNTYPITSHHILPRNSFQVGTPCWYKYPVSRAPWGESTVTYRKAYARLKNWMPLGWPYHARHAAALAAQNFVDFKVVATGAAVVGTEDNCSERAAKIWSNSRSWGTKDKAFKTPTATKQPTSASTPKRGAISRPASNGATVLLIRSICDISEFVLCNRPMEKSLGDQSRFTVTSLRVVPSCSTTLQQMKAHTAGRLDLSWGPPRANSNTTVAPTTPTPCATTPMMTTKRRLVRSAHEPSGGASSDVASSVAAPQQAGPARLLGVNLSSTKGVMNSQPCVPILVIAWLNNNFFWISSSDKPGTSKASANAIGANDKCDSKWMPNEHFFQNSSYIPFDSWLVDFWSLFRVICSTSHIIWLSVPPQQIH